LKSRKVENFRKTKKGASAIVKKFFQSGNICKSGVMERQRGGGKTTLHGERRRRKRDIIIGRGKDQARTAGGGGEWGWGAWGGCDLTHERAESKRNKKIDS